MARMEPMYICVETALSDAGIKTLNI